MRVVDVCRYIKKWGDRIIVYAVMDGRNGYDDLSSPTAALTRHTTAKAATHSFVGSEASASHSHSGGVGGASASASRTKTTRERETRGGERLESNRRRKLQQLRSRSLAHSTTTASSSGSSGSSSGSRSGSSSGSSSSGSSSSATMSLPSKHSSTQPHHRQTSLQHSLMDVLIAAHAAVFMGTVSSTFSELVHLFNVTSALVDVPCT
jgi:hypothetical protein